MKRYNKPVVEIKGFEVEDIMATSTNTGFGGDTEMQAVYKSYAGGEATSTERAIVFEW